MGELGTVAQAQLLQRVFNRIVQHADVSTLTGVRIANASCNLISAAHRKLCDELGIEQRAYMKRLPSRTGRNREQLYKETAAPHIGGGRDYVKA